MEKEINIGDHFRRSGFYFALLREGRVQAGNSIARLNCASSGVSVSDIIHLYAFEHDDREGMRRAAQVEALPASWRGYFRHQLARHGGDVIANK